MEAEHSRQKNGSKEPKVRPSQVYVVVYKAFPSNGECGICDVGLNAAEFYTKKPRYCDVGDDPSIFCAEHTKFNVTWGVCRPNVRRWLRANDVVVFLACERIAIPHEWRYYLAGFGTVETLISHRELDKSCLQFADYFNKLIRIQPDGSCTQDEPLLCAYEHKDWCKRSKSPYVVFSKEIGLTKFNLNNPPKNPPMICRIRWDSVEPPHPKWEPDKEIRSLSKNGKPPIILSGRMHPAIRVDTSPDEVIRELSGLIG